MFLVFESKGQPPRCYANETLFLAEMAFCLAHLKSPVTTLELPYESPLQSHRAKRSQCGDTVTFAQNGVTSRCEIYHVSSAWEGEILPLCTETSPAFHFLL